MLYTGRLEMTARPRPLLATLTAALALVAAPALGRAAPPPKTDYLYHLATSTGVVPFSGVNLSYDPLHDELYVFGAGQIRVFNASGMEIYTFGDSTEVGTIIGLGVLDEGDIVALSLLKEGPALLRCNFRGEPVRRIALSGIPPKYADFVPNTMRYANGKVYLANLGQMTFMVVDVDGKFVSFHDILPDLEAAEGKTLDRNDLGVKGFNVDREGNMLFTIQPLFKAYVLSVSGQLRSWGIKGSAPGKFNVLGGIAADERGYYYVTDILKSAVIVFDKDFKFQREFGYRGPRPQNIVSPVAVEAGHGKVFVSQYARRGVSVFKIEFPDDAPPAPGAPRASAAN